MIWSSLPHLLRSATSSRLTLGKGTNAGLTGTPERNCLSRLLRGLGSLGDIGAFMARAPRRCKGVMREAAVDGAVEGVEAALKMEERCDVVEAGVSVGLE